MWNCLIRQISLNRSNWSFQVLNVTTMALLTQKDGEKNLTSLLWVVSVVDHLNAVSNFLLEILAISLLRSVDYLFKSQGGKSGHLDRAILLHLDDRSISWECSQGGKLWWWIVNKKTNKMIIFKIVKCLQASSWKV